MSLQCFLCGHNVPAVLMQCFLCVGALSLQCLDTILYTGKAKHRLPVTCRVSKRGVGGGLPVSTRRPLPLVVDIPFMEGWGDIHYLVSAQGIKINYEDGCCFTLCNVFVPSQITHKWGSEYNLAQQMCFYSGFIDYCRCH